MRRSIEERLASLEEERARARREADEQGAEVEALRAQVRATCTRFPSEQHMPPQQSRVLRWTRQMTIKIYMQVSGV